MNYHETVQKIEDLLHEKGCTYKKFEHEPVRTSEEAHAVRPEYSLEQGAKALIVRVKKGKEKSFAQIVVPGDKKFDSKKVREALRASDIRFATEEEVGKITNGVKPGGVPPFGVLWDLPVICEKSLLENKEIIFNAGDRSVSIAITPEDYITAVNPKMVDVVT